MTLEKKKSSLIRQDADNPVDERITEALATRRRDNTLSCAEAFDIARKLEVEKIEVGKALDIMKIKIVKCQLGLFGHKDGKRTKPDNSPPEALLDALSPFRGTSRMPCSHAHEIARRHNTGRLAVANACEALGIKIKPCQLGAF